MMGPSVLGRACKCIDSKPINIGTKKFMSPLMEASMTRVACAMKACVADTVGRAQSDEATKLRFRRGVERG